MGQKQYEPELTGLTKRASGARAASHRHYSNSAPLAANDGVLAATWELDLTMSTRSSMANDGRPRRDFWAHARFAMPP
jgi:hypothetical protein